MKAMTVTIKKSKKVKAALEAKRKLAEKVPIIGPSRVTYELTRKEAQRLLEIETGESGKLFGMTLAPDVSLQSMQRILELVGRGEEIKKFLFEATVDFGERNYDW
jgi:hypothetical protein